MSKNKDRKRVDAKQSLAKAPLGQEVERLIQKGRLKDAVKQAKLCYREESTPAHHRLLERAYFLRAQQLHREAMPTAAAEVAQHLLDFGVTDPDLPAELVPLLLAVGLSGAAMAMGERLESPEAQARLILTAADQAVLHPDRAPASLAEIRQGALLVRGALEALDAGDEAGALDRLRDIARSSPFADWRYFVRGLAAMRRRDAEQVDANWDRLDAGRTASRIARALRSLTGGATTGPQARPTTAPNLRIIETAVFGEPLLTQLEQLRQVVAEDRWTDAIPILTPLRFSLRRLDARLAQRLTRILLWPLIHATAQLSPREGRQLVGSFVRAAEPLPIDPHWNRLRALIGEGPQGEDRDAEKYWQTYLADLKALPTLSPEERQRAQALVWERLGLQYADDADEDNVDMYGTPPPPRLVEHARKRTIECLEESLRADPTYLDAYRTFVTAYDDWDQLDKAEAAANRLLESFPNDVETLVWLVELHVELDQPEPALPFIQRARVLKPLDEDLRQKEWTVRVGLARHHALKRQWDQGRAEFALAEPLWPKMSESYLFHVRRAVLELKAGQVDRAGEIIEVAQRQLAEPTPVWLAILIEGDRYRLPKETMGRFNHLWEVGLAKKGKSETAGELAELLSIYLARDVKYTGQSGHVKQVIDYLKRTSRIRYRREDLLRVCTFLGHGPKAEDLLEKLAKRGLKNFPDSARFHFIAAARELEKGPYRANTAQVREHMEKALKLAQASSDPEETRLIPEFKAFLAKLEAATSGPLGMPFPGFGGPFPQNPFDMFSSMYDDMWDDDDDDDDMWDEDDGGPEFEELPRFGRKLDTGPPPAGPGPGRGTPKKTKQAKKKKKKR